MVNVTPGPHLWQTLANRAAHFEYPSPRSGWEKGT